MKNDVIEKIVIQQIETYNMDNSYIEKSMKWIEQNNVGILTEYDFEGKKNKFFEPLFYMGKKDVLKNYKMSIVGTRKPDVYAKNFLQTMFDSINEYNFTTISGFALGIDSLVHTLSLKKNIPTAAVLGNGFSINYPAYNRNLKEKIIENGLLLSPFSPFIKPYKHNFPKRNYYIALLCDALLIVEGDKYSGTLSTLNWGLKLKRKLFALPGDMDRKLSYAPNYAIYKGAEPIFDFQKIGFMKRNYKKDESKISKKEKLILEIIKTDNSLDFLILNAAFEKSEILSIITGMEMKGLIRREMNNRIVLLEDKNGKTDTAD